MELFDDTDPDWPPDPADIDLYDGNWDDVPNAAHRARCSVSSMWRSVGKRNISIKLEGKRYVFWPRYAAQPKKGRP